MMLSSERRRSLLFLLLLLGIAATLYRRSLLDLSAAVLHREGSSHGLFVPFIFAYFLWLKFDKIRNIKPHTALLPGMAMLAAGLLFLYLRDSLGLSSSILSFLFIAGGLVPILFGTEIFREIAFPLFFLTTIIPLPPYIYAQIADWMKNLNTIGAAAVTKTLGVPLYREGFNIFLPHIHLYVAPACSGIRYLLSYFTFSLVYVYLFKESLPQRLLFVLGTIPLSVVAGITRLTVIFLAAHYISPYWAEHDPHVLLSWGVFAIWMCGVIGVDQYFMREKGGNVEPKAIGGQA